MQQNDIANLIEVFSKLDGVGPRSARRIVLQILKEKSRLMGPMIKALQDVNTNVKKCTNCGNFSSHDICEICTSDKRDGSTLCIVEDVSDLWALEKAAFFTGRYHVLGGVLSALDGVRPDDLNLKSLRNRVENEGVKEIIIATNQTIEGQTTAHYITEILSGLDVKISRPARGLPIGAELDYMDDGTLSTALRERTDFV